MPRCECANFVLDPEEPADERVHMRREREQQLRLGFRRKTLGRSTAAEQVRVQTGLRSAKAFEEKRIDALQAFVLVEVLESEPGCGDGNRCVHCGKSKKSQL
jgi:hypothetical protein